MEGLLKEEFNVDLIAVVGQSTKANLDRLSASSFDMALAENYLIYQPGANATFSIYREILHIFYREEPSSIERYAELGGVLLSIAIASISGLVSLTKWQAQKRKDKVDEFYE